MLAALAAVVVVGTVAVLGSGNFFQGSIMSIRSIGTPISASPTLKIGAPISASPTLRTSVPIQNTINNIVPATTSTSIRTISKTGGTDTPALTPIVSSATVMNGDNSFLYPGVEYMNFEFKLTSSLAPSVLKDMTVNLSGMGSASALSSIGLRSSTSQGSCSSLKPLESVNASGANSGSVSFKDINLNLATSQPNYICIWIKANTIQSGSPESLSNVKISGITLDKIVDQNGITISSPNVDTSASIVKYFFRGVPNFAIQALPANVLTNGKLDVLKFTATKVVRYSEDQVKLNQLVISFDGVQPVSCTLSSRGANGTTESVPVSNTKLIRIPGKAMPKIIKFSGLNVNLQNSQNAHTFTVNCEFSNIKTGDVFAAKLAPLYGANEAAVIWDDGNVNPSRLNEYDSNFGLVDNVLFGYTQKSQTLSAY